MVASQGGDLSYIENPEKFEKAAVRGEITAETDGFICAMEIEEVEDV